MPVLACWGSLTVRQDNYRNVNQIHALIIRDQTENQSFLNWHFSICWIITVVILLARCAVHRGAELHQAESEPARLQHTGGNGAHCVWS